MAPTPRHHAAPTGRAGLGGAPGYKHAAPTGLGGLGGAIGYKHGAPTELAPPLPFGLSLTTSALSKRILEKDDVLEFAIVLFYTPVRMTGYV